MKKISKLFLILFSIFSINQINSCCQNKEIIEIVEILAKDLDQYLNGKESFEQVKHEIENYVIKHKSFKNLFKDIDSQMHSSIAQKILQRFFERKTQQMPDEHTSLLVNTTEELLFDIIKEVAIEEGIPVLTCICGMCVIF